MYGQEGADRSRGPSLYGEKGADLSGGRRSGGRCTVRRRRVAGADRPGGRCAVRKAL